MEPKDNRPQNTEAPVKAIEAPEGLDLHPSPQKVLRVNRRATLAVGTVGLLLLVGFAYGGYRRQISARADNDDARLPKRVVPAITAGTEFTKDLLAGQLTPGHQLQPPGTSEPASIENLPCGQDPKTGGAYHFDPLTGRPCEAYIGMPQERIVIRQAPTVRNETVAPSPAEPSPDERRLVLAYQREQEAQFAPTAVSSGNGSAFRSGAGFGSSSGDQDDVARVAALGQALGGTRGAEAPEGSVQRALGLKGSDADSDPNLQTRKEAFLAAAHNRQSDDYLRSTRSAPLSSYEIKAGWEIPAVLEQSLNSDLPGELKALITSSVYDTATGRYLLIPQGSRLIGQYDSHIAYGQDGVQVVWERIIYPDGSSMDLKGMVGLDRHGNAGLRDKVDHHYKRLLGFAALTTMFNAGLAMSQRQNQSILAYPSPGQVASRAATRDMSELGAQVSRRNLNVQPTIKVPVGYKLTVRVNRDMLFDAPYEAAAADPVAIKPSEQLRRRSAFSAAAIK